MSKTPRIIGVILIVAGCIQIAAGSVTYYLVQRELADENITVSDDADAFAGDEVRGPLTAYSEAATIKKHAAEIADGLTYAELDREDPRRETVMTSSFLRASLFTSVVAFGVAALVVGLGVLFVLVGIALLSITSKRRDEQQGVNDVVVVAPPPEPDPVPVPATAPAPAPAETDAVAPTDETGTAGEST